LTEEDEAEGRPKAVTVIGRLWMVLAVFCLCKALVNLAVWKVLEPDAPSLFGDVAAQAPGVPFLRPLLAHLTALMTAQALWWAFVGIAAFGLLRIRPWARLAIQGVCSALLVYVCAVAFGVFWSVVSPTLPARGAGAIAFGTSHRMLALVGGLTVVAAASAGLIWMIVLLRTPRVRAAFRAGQGDLGPVG
jgi:hypothetical protein